MRACASNHAWFKLCWSELPPTSNPFFSLWIRMAMGQDSSATHGDEAVASSRKRQREELQEPKQQRQRAQPVEAMQTSAESERTLYDVYLVE